MLLDKDFATTSIPMEEEQVKLFNKILSNKSPAYPRLVFKSEGRQQGDFTKYDTRLYRELSPDVFDVNFCLRVELEHRRVREFITYRDITWTERKVLNFENDKYDIALKTAGKGDEIRTGIVICPWGLKLLIDDCRDENFVYTGAIEYKGNNIQHKTTDNTFLPIRRIKAFNMLKMINEGGIGSIEDLMNFLRNKYLNE